MGEIGCGPAGPGLGMLPLEATVGDLLSHGSFGRAGASRFAQISLQLQWIIFRIEKIRGAGCVGSYLFSWLR